MFTSTPNRAWVLTAEEHRTCEPEKRLLCVFTDEVVARSTCEELNAWIDDLSRVSWTRPKAWHDIDIAKAAIRERDAGADFSTSYYIIEVPLGAIELP